MDKSNGIDWIIEVVHWCEYLFSRIIFFGSVWMIALCKWSDKRWHNTVWNTHTHTDIHFSLEHFDLFIHPPADLAWEQNILYQTSSPAQQRQSHCIFRCRRSWCRFWTMRFVVSAQLDHSMQEKRGEMFDERRHMLYNDEKFGQTRNR